MSDKPSNYELDDELLSAYLDGELSADERAAVEARLATDPAAQQLLHELRSVSQSVQALPTESLGRDLSEEIIRRAREAAPDAGRRADRKIRCRIGVLALRRHDAQDQNFQLEARLDLGIHGPGRRPLDHDRSIGRRSGKETAARRRTQPRRRPNSTGRRSRPTGPPRNIDIRCARIAISTTRDRRLRR